MTVKPQIFRTQAEQDLIRQFEERFSKAQGSLSAVRRDAFGTLREAGLPHRRVEEYRYTDLKTAFKSIPEIAERPSLEEAGAALARAGIWGDVERRRIVFADGHFFPELSDMDIAGIEIAGVAAALDAGEDVVGRIGQILPEKSDASLDLNTAFMVDGVMVEVAAGARSASALEFVFLTVAATPSSHYVRNAFRIGEGAALNVLETHLGADGIENHSNVVFEVTVADEANLNWVKLQKSGDETLHLGTTLSRIGREATFDHFVFTTGSRLSRSQSFLTFQDRGAVANLRGVTMLRGKEHADITLLVDHAVPECISQERFKAVIDDKAKGVFQGKIIVRPHAQKTDGQMMTQTLLLSDDAQMANKPELEIFADDVQCAHGATTGQIDEDLLFYLMARGIPKEQAKTLLVLAFIGETIEEIGHTALEERLESLSRDWLLGEGGGL